MTIAVKEMETKPLATQQTPSFVDVFKLIEARIKLFGRINSYLEGVGDVINNPKVIAMNPNYHKITSFLLDMKRWENGEIDKQQFLKKTEEDYPEMLDKIKRIDEQTVKVTQALINVYKGLKRSDEKPVVIDEEYAGMQRLIADVGDKGLVKMFAAEKPRISNKEILLLEKLIDSLKREYQAISSNAGDIAQDIDRFIALVKEYLDHIYSLHDEEIIKKLPQKDVIRQLLHYHLEVNYIRDIYTRIKNDDNNWTYFRFKFYKYIFKNAEVLVKLGDRKLAEKVRELKKLGENKEADLRALEQWLRELETDKYKLGLEQSSTREIIEILERTLEERKRGKHDATVRIVKSVRKYYLKKQKRMNKHLHALKRDVQAKKNDIEKQWETRCEEVYRHIDEILKKQEEAVVRSSKMPQVRDIQQIRTILDKQSENGLKRATERDSLAATLEAADQRTALRNSGMLLGMGADIAKSMSNIKGGVELVENAGQAMVQDKGTHAVIRSTNGAILSTINFDSNIKTINTEFFGEEVIPGIDPKLMRELEDSIHHARDERLRGGING